MPKTRQGIGKVEREVRRHDRRASKIARKEARIMARLAGEDYERSDPRAATVRPVKAG
jgi:hypothetical protein